MAKKTSALRKAKYQRYRSEDRRYKHKVIKLTQRFKNYKEQPPKILLGISNTNKMLADDIRKRIEKLKGN